jgi:hypothetical protein
LTAFHQHFLHKNELGTESLKTVKNSPLLPGTSQLIGSSTSHALITTTDFLNMSRVQNVTNKPFQTKVN